MNILVICHYGNYYPEESSFVHAQTKEYVKLGHHVRVIVPVALGTLAWGYGRWRSEPRHLDGVDIHPIRYLSLSNYGKRWFNTFAAVNAIKYNLDNVLKNFDVDVIHAHTIGLDSKIGAYFKKITGAPLVITTHGSDTFLPQADGTLFRYRTVCNQADALVAVSSLLKRTLQLCGTNTSISVILNGYQRDNVVFGGEKRDGLILQAGSLIKRKRTNTTICAVSLLHKIIPNVRLEVVGEGPEQEDLQRLVETLKIQEAVQFCGQITNSKLLKKMSEAQFFIMPSVNEGFGIVYLEAMSSGCITIGTENEGISDLIVNGVNGFLVPPDNPEAIARVIEWCMKNREEALSIAERGKRVSLELTWEKNAKEYIALFRELIGECK